METTRQRRVDRAGNEYLVVGRVWTKPPPVREVVLGGERVEVVGEASPSFGGGPNGSRHRVVRRDGALRIVPSLQAWVVGAAVGVGLPAVWFILITRPGWVSSFRQPVLGGTFVTLLLWGLGLLSAHAAVTTLADRSEFDRRVGCRRAWAVPLAEVVAVQCLHTGWFRLKNGWNSAYQVNLVLRRAGGERVEVASDW